MSENPPHIGFSNHLVQGEKTAIFHGYLHSLNFGVSMISPQTRAFSIAIERHQNLPVFIGFGQSGHDQQRWRLDDGDL